MESDEGADEDELSDRRQIDSMRHGQFQHHDGDEDGNHAIAERFHSCLAHVHSQSEYVPAAHRRDQTTVSCARSSAHPFSRVLRRVQVAPLATSCTRRRHRAEDGPHSRPKPLPTRKRPATQRSYKRAQAQPSSIQPAGGGGKSFGCPSRMSQRPCTFFITWAT